jgi:hypothetical protein
MTTVLPPGYKTLEDEAIIAYLCKDELFIESIEAEYGKLSNIYPDWHSDHLVYEFYEGDPKCSNLTEIIRVLRKQRYLDNYKH